VAIALDASGGFNLLDTTSAAIQKPGQRPRHSSNLSVLLTLSFMPRDTSRTPMDLSRTGKRKADAVAPGSDESDESFSGNARDGKSHRGKEWSEEDSILLVKAHAAIEASKKRISD